MFPPFISIVSVSTDLPIHLVGFSKGVIVLNQLITELAICKREGFKSNNRREGQLADVSSYHKFFSQVHVAFISSRAGGLLSCLTDGKLTAT